MGGSLVVLLYVRLLSMWLCLFSSSSISTIFVYSAGVVKDTPTTTATTIQGFVFIDGSSAIGEIDGDFICATLDWWPPEKCDYGTCSWDHASLLNMVSSSSSSSSCACFLIMFVFVYL